MDVLEKVKELDISLPVIERDNQTFLTEEYAKMMKLAPRTARERLAALRVAGKLESVRVRQGNRVVCGWRLKDAERSAT